MTTQRPSGLKPASVTVLKCPRSNWSRFPDSASKILASLSSLVVETRSPVLIEVNRRHSLRVASKRDLRAAPQIAHDHDLTLSRRAPARCLGDERGRLRHRAMAGHMHARLRLRSPDALGPRQG